MTLPGRFAVHLRALAPLEEGDTALVACSGGLDSVVLLHLLRFAPGVPRLRWVVAHFDHRMRPGSGDDAAWVRGLARAWSLECRTGAAEGPLASEDDARRARYAFLRGAQRAKGARWLLTAHHADDQAETVLFRALRGTGTAGLQGIPARGREGLVRPLLPFWRQELEVWAAAMRIPWRADPTNADDRWARNVLRSEVIPRVEAAVAPGARRALVRLARRAQEEEAAWQAWTAEELGRLVLAEGPGRLEVDREALLAHPEPVRARLLRALALRVDAPLDAAGTRAAVAFTSSGLSGRRRVLTGALVLAREFDRLVLLRAEIPGRSESIEVTEPGEGGGVFELGGRRWRARWTCADLSEASDAPGAQAFAPDALSFPLRLRGWVPGDRIRMPYGSKKLKKLFAEARVPAGERCARPVLVDRASRVLWVPGLARAADAPPPTDGPRLLISVEENDAAH